MRLGCDFLLRPSGAAGFVEFSTGCATPLASLHPWLQTYAPSRRGKGKEEYKMDSSCEVGFGAVGGSHSRAFGVSMPHGVGWFLASMLGLICSRLWCERATRADSI